MRAYIQISKSAILSNLNYYKDLYQLPIIGVVKSNAYGHGATLVTKIIKDQVLLLAVATFHEAVELKHLNTGKILIFEEVDLNLIKNSDCSNFIFTIASLKYLKEIKKENIKVEFHLKVNTGMNRLGIDFNQIEQFLKILSNSNLKMSGIYTHYSSKNSSVIENQLFSKFIEAMPNQNILIHTGENTNIHPLCNSLRLGIGLYGIANKLKQIMNIKVPISAIRKIKKNTSIGYDKNHFAPADGYVYTLPLGYGDGWLKEVIPEFNNAIQLGPICMDYMMLFSEEKLPDSHLFTIFNESKNILYYCQKYNVFKYQLVTHLNNRLTRLLVD